MAMTHKEIRQMNRNGEAATRLGQAAHRASLRERKIQEKLLIKEIRSASFETGRLLLLRAAVNQVVAKRG